MPTVPGLSSGTVDPDRPAKPTHACPKCGSPLKGGPVLYWCQLRHAFTAADLEVINERRVHWACEARAAELELERATHTPEWREHPS